MRRFFALFILLAVMGPACAQQTDVLTEMWRNNLMPAIDEIALMEDVWIKDIDEDGRGEVVVVTSGLQNTKYTNKINTVQAFRANGTVKWYYGIDDRVLNAKLFDINNDRQFEVLVTSGEELNRIQRGKIRIIGPDGDLSRIIERGDMASAIFDVFDIGDLEGDRDYEIVAGSRFRAYLIKRYGETIWTFPPKGVGNFNRSVSYVAFHDMDQDDRDDVLIGVDSVLFIKSNGFLMGSIDLEPDLEPKKKGYRFISRANLGPTQYPSTLVITESDQVMSITMTEITSQGSERPKLKLQKDWKLTLKCRPKDWALHNIDSDDYDELIIACSDNKIYAVDNNGLIQWDYPLDGEPEDLVIEDMNGDDRGDILTCANSGSIYLIDGSGSYLWKYTADTPLKRVGAGYLDDDEIKEVAVLTENADVIALTINETYNLRRRADTLYNLGQQAYIISDYEKAKGNFEQAKVLYLRLADQRSILDCDEFLRKIDDQMRRKRKEQADILLSKARDYFFQEEYDSSKSNAERAIKLYEEFGNTEGILNCELLLIQIEKQQGLYKTTTTFIIQTTTTTVPMISEEDYSILIYVGGGLIAFMAFGVMARGKKKKAKGGVDESLDELSELWDQEFEEGGEKNENTDDL